MAVAVAVAMILVLVLVLAMTGVGSWDRTGDKGSFLTLSALAPPALPPLPLALPPLTPPAPPLAPPPAAGIDVTNGVLTAVGLGLVVGFVETLLLLLLIPLIDSSAAVVVLPNEPLPPLRAETAPAAEAVR